jgi:ADP-heptose:LPS heptosyltransferase
LETAIGIGDWILATADVAKAHKKHGVRCVLGDGKKAYWSEVFENNPKIAKTLEKDEQFAWVPNVPQNRPYLTAVLPNFQYREDFRAVPGELYLTDEEQRPKGDYILIEPNTKDKFTGPNKAWRWERWEEVVKIPYRFVQTGAEGERTLPGVERIVTKTFREALSVLSGARMLVTTDGALHHAAAALGVPAVVIWGGAASPVNLGYESHVNLWSGAVPCGTHSGICLHCREALDAVSVDTVKDAISAVYQASA